VGTVLPVERRPRSKMEAEMHDLVIRNAKIVDGTGAPAFAGDISIDGERSSTSAAPQDPDIVKSMRAACW